MYVALGSPHPTDTESFAAAVADIRHAFRMTLNESHVIKKAIELYLNNGSTRRRRAKGPAPKIDTIEIVWVEMFHNAEREGMSQLNAANLVNRFRAAEGYPGYVCQLTCAHCAMLRMACVHHLIVVVLSMLCTF
jgi:hypothetical protein